MKQQGTNLARIQQRRRAKKHQQGEKKEQTMVQASWATGKSKGRSKSKKTKATAASGRITICILTMDGEETLISVSNSASVFDVKCLFEQQQGKCKAEVI